MIVDINDVEYLRVCSKGSHLCDPFFINYEVAAMSATDKRTYFMYVIFYQILLKLFKAVSDNREVRIDNLGDVIFSKMKEFLPYEVISSPLSIVRYERLSRIICSRVVEILTDLNGGVILNYGTTVNSEIRSLGESSYVRHSIDFSYFDANGELKILLFEPFKGKSVYNIKTGLAYSFWSELATVSSINVFSLGSDVVDLVNPSYMVAFNETRIVLDDRKRELLGKIASSVKNTYLCNNVSYDHCHVCSMKQLCRSKINV